MEDENIKRAKAATNFAMLQDKAKEFQDKSDALQNKVYQGTVQGVTIVMRGSHEVLEVKLDQNFYEISGKEGMEIAILRCLTNINNAIKLDQVQLQKEMQNELMALQRSANDGNY